MLLSHMVSGALRAAKNEPVVRRVTARSERPNTGPKDWFSGIDDETWFWMNTTGRRRRKAVARLLPEMPEASIQEGFTGSSGDSSLREGFNAYRLFKKCYETHVGPIGSCRGVLDFGCGWGRIIRFFLKDVEPEKLAGVDALPDGIRICREAIRWCKFTLIEPYPPTPLPSESFGVIYLYSVFPHLPEEMHWMLLREFHRLLAPGGMLIATTRARDFVQSHKDLSLDPGRHLARIFADADAALLAYDNGKYVYECYDDRSPGGFPFWGEACIPRKYVESRWPEIFDVYDFIDDRKACPQNVIVARKRAIVAEECIVKR